MPIKLPYVALPGMIPRIFEKIKHAQTPERFTVDFLETKLGFRGGNYRQFIPLAKKLGFLGSDGRPSDRYKRYRNNATSGSAMSEAIRSTYSEIYERNEYAHDLDSEKFKDLVVEITGLAPKDKVVQLICATFKSLKALATFESGDESGTVATSAAAAETAAPHTSEAGHRPHGTHRERVEIPIGLSYSINLVLPKSEDVAVYNAIFTALREHLLSK